MKYYKGNIRIERKEMGGWIVGRFHSGLKKNKNVALKKWSYKKGQDTSSHLTKFERKATEITFILKGRVQGLLDGKKITLKEGDYVIIPPKIKSNLVLKVLEFFYNTFCFNIKSLI
jgi:quercetin dioxygenase-like cupin family protein